MCECVCKWINERAKNLREREKEKEREIKKELKGVRVCECVC